MADPTDGINLQPIIETFGQAPGADDGWRVVKVTKPHRAWWHVDGPRGKYDREAEGWLRLAERKLGPPKVVSLDAPPYADDDHWQDACLECTFSDPCVSRSGKAYDRNGLPFGPCRRLARVEAGARNEAHAEARRQGRE